MAVYAYIYWFYNDNGILHSIDNIKISDIISYDRYKKTYQNLRFDDYYIINEAKNKIIEYINNSFKHEYFDARVSHDFLPEIFIEAKDYS